VTDRFAILTLFPEIFDSFLATSLIGKALSEGRIEVRRIDIRTFATDRHRKVDDTPYGGGAGMVLMVEPTVAALEAAPRGRRVLLTPQGRPFDQDLAREMSSEGKLVLVCGRYEGFDERIRDHVDDEISLGDFVLQGGEVAAMAVMETIVRLGDRVLGNPASAEDESHCDGLLEYPQYTRPRSFRGAEVPAVLLSGDHAAIARYRREQRLERTLRRRPDLLERAELTEQDRRVLARLVRKRRDG
jgi:tRNA (guanine37-N1)-methyltransferase